MRPNPTWMFGGNEPVRTVVHEHYTQHRFRLRQGQYLVDPSSTKGKRVYGPCTALVQCFDDGGITLVVNP